ncbi:DeoR/GlpR transcriptional regulator [Vagococcus sp. BWB3-3]|uniref:DeoR/GlpR transcriptional regulator n=1 Tax=Vagococcus allomyrinae TaxID=2794353 RepID=A0A940PA14_9ENTE|nr:DeoR/GlpR family DNA-binding transcription regulator [Vagococcus allomyrinae]MBP1041199.1 DeoR/GlpR transcriptional regulator [Vagococcus allomyrinae]
MKVQRIHEIESYVKRQGAASLNELCEAFDVSKNTIRRDTNYLIKKGLFEKVYGGVVLKEDNLVSFENRQIKNQEEKRLIGKEAAKLIEEDDLIYVDSGTTTKYLMEFVPPDMSFTVVTNNLDVINTAAQLENIQLLVVGSKYKRKTRSFIEMQNHQILQNFNINKAFMAATGLTLQNGLTNSDMLETQIKKVICEKASQIYVMVDASKFGHSTLLTYAQLDEIDAIISGGAISKEYLSYFKQQNIDLHTAY